MAWQTTAAPKDRDVQVLQKGLGRRLVVRWNEAKNNYVSVETGVPITFDNWDELTALPTVSLPSLPVAAKNLLQTSEALLFVLGEPNDVLRDLLTKESSDPSNVVGAFRKAVTEARAVIS